MDSADEFKQHMNREIQDLLAALTTDQTVTEAELKATLERLANTAVAAGQKQSLSSLITTEDLQNHFGISQRRAIALANQRHDKFGIGFRLTDASNSRWFFNASDLELLRPDKNRPRGKYSAIGGRAEEQK